MNWAPTALLDTLDRGHRRPPPARAFLLLTADGVDPAAVWAAGPGEANLALLELCRTTFALAMLRAVADCPACGARLETSFDADALYDWLSPDVASPRTHAITHGRYTLTVRGVTLADLRTAADADDLASARRVLFERCILSAERNGEATPPDEMPEDVVAAVSTHLGEHDRAGDPRIGLTCADCGHAFDAGLDPAAHAWLALEAAATRLRGDVVVLARAFGWTEPDILALGERRRAAYIESCQDI